MITKILGFTMGVSLLLTTLVSLSGLFTLYTIQLMVNAISVENTSINSEPPRVKKEK